MRDKRKSRLLQGCRLGLSAMALGQLTIGPALQPSSGPGFLPEADTRRHADADQARHRDHRREPQLRPRLRHLRAQAPGETVYNLLSEGIIKLDSNNNAIPGPNFQKAHQLSATDVGTTDRVPAEPAASSPSPATSLPAPLVGGPKVSYISNSATALPITNSREPDAGEQSENGLASGLLSSTC